MNKYKYILSICIPTYNRLHLLEKTLETLLPQAELSGVEVCISDNHSSDGTAAYLTKIKEQYRCLNIQIQPTNIGLDRNMLSVISMGTGKYIYPLGDDDFLQEDAIQLVLNELADGADIVVLNGKHTDPNLQGETLHLSAKFQGVVFSSPVDAFPSVWDKMPFGSFLATRECFDPAYFIKYIGTSHAYTGVVWDAIAAQFVAAGYCRIRFGTVPVVLLRGGEKSWRNDAARIMLFEIPLWFTLVMASPLYKSSIIHCLQGYIQEQLKMRNLLRYRATGQLDNQLIKRASPFYSENEVKVMHYVSMIPVVPLKIVMPILYRVKKVFRWLKN